MGVCVCRDDLFIDTGSRGNAILGGNALAAAGDVYLRVRGSCSIIDLFARKSEKPMPSS